MAWQSSGERFSVSDSGFECLICMKRGTLEWYAKHPCNYRKPAPLERQESGDHISDLLDARAKHYGKFVDQARIAQDLKTVVHRERGHSNLSVDQAEALDMILHKIARIINGDPNHIDSWVDVAGYASLISDRLQGIAR
jgi:hypothetical protein